LISLLEEAKIYMNRIYSLVWSAARGAYVVTSEASKAQGKQDGRTARITLGSAALSALMLTATQSSLAACTTAAINETLNIASGSGCTYIGSTYEGGNITNEDSISTATGYATNLLGNAGSAVVYLTGGTVSNPNVFTNNGTLTNNYTSATAGEGIKTLFIKNSANVYNNGTLLQHDPNSRSPLQLQTAILFFPAASTDVFNLTNTGTITGDGYGIYLNANGVTSITNGSASNHTAKISSTYSGGSSAILVQRAVTTAKISSLTTTASFKVWVHQPQPA